MQKLVLAGLILSSLLYPIQASAVTVSSRVNSDNDDAEERISNGNVSRGSTDLELVFDSGLQIVGMRFNAVAVPQGATINSAYIEFVTDETDSNSTSVTIYAEDSDNAPAIGGGNSNLSNRTSTGSTVDWNNIPAWNSVNEIHQTPDLSSIIQELVDRPGWSSGNSMLLMIGPGQGGSCSGNNCQRTAESHNGEPASAPLLVIDYTDNAGGAATCDTFRDNFDTRSYGNQDGSVPWSGDWSETGDGGGPNGGDLQITGNRLRVRDDNNSISRAADLSAYTTATLSFDYEESGLDSSSEYVDVEIRSGGAGAWTRLFRYQGSTNTSGSESENIDAYINATTEIRFITPSGGMNNSDTVFFDNVQIEACTSGPITPYAWFQLDETPGSINGTPGELVDQQGNANAAFALGTGSGVNTAPAQVCNGIDIPFNNTVAAQYVIDTGIDIDDDIGNQGTISFWYKSNANWNGGGDRALFDASPDDLTADDIFFLLRLRNDGELVFAIEDESTNDFFFDTSSGTSTAGFLADEWVHIAVTWDMSSSRQIFVNGNLVATDNRVTTNQQVGEVRTLYMGDNRSSYHFQGTPNSANGVIDEVRIYQGVQLQADIMADMNATHACPGVICNATFRDEFSSSSFGNNDGDANFSANWEEYEGSSLTNPEGSPNPAAGKVRIVGGQLVMNNFSPESANAPGVERELDLSAFSSATFSFDFTTSGGVDNDDSILVQVSADGGNNWTLLENITGIGDISGSRSYNISTYISTNTKIRLRFNTTINSGACCYGASPETISFDNVNIDASGACVLVDRYAIGHSGQGVTCEAEPITITAFDASDNPVAPAAGTTITLSTSIANDGWALRSGGGTFSSPQYTFDGVETAVELWLTKTTATAPPHMDIDVDDGSVTDPDDGGAEDPPLAFSDTGFRFYANGSHNSIGTQIAGKTSDSGVEVLTLRAVRTNTDTMACEARIAGDQVVSMAFECIDPDECETPAGVTITDTDSTVDPGGDTLRENNAGASPLLYSDVDLFFDATGSADWVINYQDAGQIRLHALLDIPAVGEDPADTLAGTSNTFTVVPAGLCVYSPDSNADCASGDANCSAFRTAADDFNLAVRAVAWQAAGETNTDFCVGNATTPNFQLGGISIGRNVVAPSATDGGSIGLNPGATSIDITDADDGDATLEAQWVKEVGVFTFTATASYFGEIIAPSTSANIGRFYPDYFLLANPSLTDRIDTGCISSFTYTGENFEVSYDLQAFNLDDEITENYTSASGFAKLNLPAELNYGAADTAIPQDLTARLNTASPSIDFVTGIAANITDTLSLARLTTGADGPFTVSVGIAPIDNNDTPADASDDIALRSYDLDVDGVGGDDHGEIAMTTINYGRLTVANSFGSELLPQNILLKTQYFDSALNSFVTNPLDNCTSYDTATDIDLASATYTAPLTDALLGLSNSATARLTAGRDRFVLHDDSDPSRGPDETGEVLYTFTVPAYLQYDWNADGLFTDSPPAKATFGVFSGDDRQIYIRQIFSQ